MNDPEETMSTVVGICASCANLFMCEGADEDDEGDVIIKMVCLVLNEEVDIRIAKCSHFVRREEEGQNLFLTNPYG
jgi:hypothetical protein